MKLKNKNKPDDSSLFDWLAIGMLTMWAVMHYAGFIGQLISLALPTADQPTPTVASVSAAATTTREYTDEEIQSVLHQSGNIYTKTDTPTPAQAILEGRETKFLVGL